MRAGWSIGGSRRWTLEGLGEALGLGMCIRWMGFPASWAWTRSKYVLGHWVHFDDVYAGMQSDCATQKPCYFWAQWASTGTPWKRGFRSLGQHRTLAESCVPRRGVSSSHVRKPHIVQRTWYKLLYHLVEIYRSLLMSRGGYVKSWHPAGRIVGCKLNSYATITYIYLY